MDDPRTLVVTIDAYHMPEGAWLALTSCVNHAIDQAISPHCRDGALVWRRSDDVSRILEGDEP